MVPPSRKPDAADCRPAGFFPRQHCRCNYWQVFFIYADPKFQLGFTPPGSDPFLLFFFAERAGTRSAFKTIFGCHRAAKKHIVPLAHQDRRNSEYELQVQEKHGIDVPVPDYDVSKIEAVHLYGMYC